MLLKNSTFHIYSQLISISLVSPDLSLQCLPDDLPDLPAHPPGHGARLRVTRVSVQRLPTQAVLGSVRRKRQHLDLHGLAGVVGAAAAPAGGGVEGGEGDAVRAGVAAAGVGEGDGGAGG